jgi:murein L,D-transpeptidase YcbB/YkuD
MVGPAAAQRRAGEVDSLVARFYEASAGRPAWGDGTAVSPSAKALRSLLAHAADEGLDPRDYETAASDSLLGPSFDSVLTRAFLQYALAVSHGQVDPPAVDSRWRAAPQTTDLVPLLEGALQSGRVTAVLHALAPPQPGYAALRRALARYRTLAASGGWSRVPGGGALAAGARGSRVGLLRRRLQVEGYVVTPEDAADSFDGGLDAAIREFQERHGLTPDGSVGAATLRALNVPAAARARQVELNLERWRWLPRSLGSRYLMVNSASFTLVVDGGQQVLAMRAIVGRPDWPTPIVSARLTELIFRPAWRVPRAIAARELLPLVQHDRGYLAREGMDVFADSAPGSGKLDPATIDWRAVTDSSFTYQLVQQPGPTNPLGGVKFVFWTPFDVFIHDTPARPLFSERLRAFSHGCVRVEQAADLAIHLLPAWPVYSINAAMTSGRERRVRLAAPIPVHLVYFTAWSDQAGVVEFRDDGYGWDERLANALTARAPAGLQIARARMGPCSASIGDSPGRHRP